MTSREKFIRLLRDDILKFDLAELDFGIYRILNYRRTEIERFLNEDLPNLISQAIGVHGSSRLEEVKRQLEELRQGLNQAAQSFGLATAFQDGVLDDRLTKLPNGQKYLEFVEELRELEAQSGFSESEEENLYKHLYDFFSRYYRDGDFVTQMRRSRNVTYVAPYHGEDVHFFWKSYGSHYVKTAEELQTYSFIPNGWRVQFILVTADVEKDNNKGSDRFFIPNVEQVALDDDQKIVTIPFEFRPLSSEESSEYSSKGDAAQDQIVNVALAALMPKLPGGIQRDEVARHLKRYVRKNRSDYFVHPKLGEFLNEELDYYLKTFFLDLDAFTSPEAIRERFIKYQALQDIGSAIIDLLDQIESFQARLFEKRRFVLETSYLIPIRFVPRNLWADVLQNEAQLAAWRELFKLEGDITEKTLLTHPTLVLNTRYFDRAFAIKALSMFDDLDEAVDGILVKGENYGALRTLQPVFEGEIEHIYIDPPYNKGDDEDFLYKDEFSRHSTWLTMMADRLMLARQMLMSRGAIFVSVDDNEQSNVRGLMDKIFGIENLVTSMVWQGGLKNDSRLTSVSHDYIISYVRDKAQLITQNIRWRTRKKGIDEIYVAVDTFKRQFGQDYVAISNALKDWYKKLSKNHPAKSHKHYSWVDKNGIYFAGDISWPGGGGPTYDVLHPITKKPVTLPKRGWVFPDEKTMLQAIRDNRVHFGEDENSVPNLKRYLHETEGEVLPSVIYKDRRAAFKSVRDIIGGKGFRNPKDATILRRLIEASATTHCWIMDFFAGSGTTGDAVINLNRQDNGYRKFILVEMGNYFDTILVPRILKIMYTLEWKDGSPVDEPVLEGFSDEASLPEWVQRSPRLIKVIRTESFEDSLNALELPTEREMRLSGQRNLLFNDELHYLFGALEDESLVLLNTQALEHPFDYKLRVLTPEGMHTIDVDLIETANLLLGLRVRQMHELYDDGRRYVIVEAREGNAEVLVVWRDITDLDPARERDFIREHFDLDEYNIVYTNADSAIAKGDQVLDKAFRTRMLEPDQGLL